MDYLLDTNVLIIYSRSADIARRIERDHQLFDGSNDLAVSVVTIGEINSLIAQYGYGKRRKKSIQNVLDKVLEIDINIRKILDLYGQIDAYSQGKLKDKKGNFTSRNMGKNDLWIAATASAFDMVLVTTDQDFVHLDGEFIKLKYIDIEKYRKGK
ncbi:type II toxin-antitoxin system VapC family toxin [Phaeodactylibacter luteus]|uniref:Type II toxin-antitoxin system VapC family toxin n=1 Tax=Phaeodactylibacter luteus TaxID=1564516 RepID=A0A5C6RG81_9BACT|nr:type II toxin-antitoxin system VapC family toxin [Phaeodactylibacter luteus]TXB57466.1 type II toxin-antitoxin system VapC family toxin [Phaeodactylibacter luteus]